MNSLLYYYNNVQKMAAYKQAKRMQRGVKLGYNEPPTQGTTTKFVTPPIAIGTDDLSLEYYGNTYGGNVATGRYNIYQAGIFSMGPTPLGTNGMYNISLGGESIVVLNFNLTDLEERFHLVVTRQGTTAKVYINGELKATKEQSEVKDLGDLQLAIANSSDVGFVRVWNMCLSADDVTDHYNNGDPMGYVVPKAMRVMGPEWPIILPEVQFNIDSPYSIRFADITSFDSRYLYECKYRIDEFDYDPQIGLIAIYSTKATFTGDSNILVAGKQGKIGTTLTCYIQPEIGSIGMSVYGGQPANNYTTRNLKVTILSLRPVGLIAEYLPQNLMYGRDDKTIATSWLDSAKQLPLSDEYMEPLFQSIGGYDMAANGAPEILYNE